MRNKKGEPREWKTNECDVERKSKSTAEVYSQHLVAQVPSPQRSGLC